MTGSNRLNIHKRRAKIIPVDEADFEFTGEKLAKYAIECLIHCVVSVTLGNVFSTFIITNRMANSIRTRSTN